MDRITRDINKNKIDFILDIEAIERIESYLDKGIFVLLQESAALKLTDISSILFFCAKNDISEKEIKKFIRDSYEEAVKLCLELLLTLISKDKKKEKAIN